MKTIEKEYDELKTEVEALRIKNSELANEVTVFKSVIETKDELLAKYSAEAAQAQNDPDALKKDQEAVAKIAELEQCVSTLKKENDELSGELIVKREQAGFAEDLKKKIEALERENEALKKDSNTTATLDKRGHTMCLIGGGTITESELGFTKHVNDTGSILIRAHAKIKQMSDCVKKLLEGKAMENPKYASALSRYQKVSEVLLEAEHDLSSFSAAAKSVLHPIADLTSQTTFVGDKENLPSELNSAATSQSVDEPLLIAGGCKKSSGNQSAFLRRASALMRPASALTNHRIINLPPAESVEISVPLTAREKRAEKVAEFKKVIGRQTNKSNPKCRSQLSLGDATRVLRPMTGSSNTPSSNGRMQPRGFKDNKIHC